MRRHDRASVLMLMPAGVLIVILLGAIAFDLSVVFLRQRHTSSAAGDVANDLATLAVDEAEFRATGTFQLNPQKAEEIGHRLLAESDIAKQIIHIDVRVPYPDTVQVTVAVRVDYIFAKAIPGAHHHTEVHATATAVTTSG